jgi:hypothetical protein
MSITFSQNQRQLMQDISGEVTIIESFAGGSRTTIILTLMAWLLLQKTEVLLIVTSTNTHSISAICSSLRDKLAYWGCDREIIMTGCGADDNNNKFERQLRRQRDDIFDSYKEFYTALDADLSAVVSVLSSASMTQNERLAVCCITQKLLTLRFEHLERLVYPACRASQVNVWDNVGCLGVSCSMLTQLNAENSEWNKQIRLRKRVFLFQEECQNESPETEAIMFQGVEAAVLVGDTFQARCFDVPCQLHESPDLRAAKGQPTDAQAASPCLPPLRGHSTSKWAYDNPRVQVLRACESFRMCEPGLTVWREISGKTMEDCIAGTLNHSTHYLPILVRQSTDWCHNQAGENIASGVLFSAVLLVVSLELVVATSSGQPISIVVHGLLPVPLRALEHYMKTALPELCECLRLSLKVKCQDTYGWCVESLKKQGILQFCGPCNDGLVAMVSIPIIPRHAGRDPSWRVSASQTTMLYSALSRGSHRIYPLIEDLRWELCVPVSGDENLDRQVTELGLRTTTASRPVNKTWTRAQVTISRACDVFQKLLSECNCNKWLTSTPRDTRETCFPAILTSHNLKELLSIPDLPWAEYSKFALSIYERLNFEGLHIHTHTPVQTLSEFLGSKHFNELMGEEETDEKANSSIQAPDLQRYHGQSRPSADWLSVFWRKFIIDALAVSITNHQEAIVQIPLAAQLPQVSNLVQNKSDWIDPAYLAEAIVRVVSDTISSTSISEEELNGVTFHRCVRLHKNDVLPRNQDMFFAPSCSGQKPAFIIDAVVTDLDGEMRKSTEVLHLHPCAGFEHAHTLQQVLLARCKHHAVACAVVSAACHLVGFSYKRNLVQCFIDDAEARQEVENRWDLLMQPHSLTDASSDLPACPRDCLTPLESSFLSGCFAIGRTNSVNQTT